ncbi:MAG: hypothetical protein QOI82_2797 [Actinomycetota bacterium]|nr:hypothetical protein [Actinomycetota bacterium]
MGYVGAVTPRAALLVIPLLLAAGCGSGATGGPSRVALGFAQAVAAHDGAKACSLIAPATKAELESSEGKPCSDAILSQQVPESTSVRSAEQYGLESRVVLDKDVVFVSRFSIGWRVVAAVCKDRGEKLPYDCQIAGE